MVHGIIACVGYAVDLADAQTPRQVAESVEDQIFGPVPEKGLGHPFDGVAAVGCALEGADPDGVAGLLHVGSEPEHDLVKGRSVPGQDQGEAAFLILARMEI